MSVLISYASVIRDAAATHSRNFASTPRQSALLHQAMIAPLADLQAKVLLDQTLVVLVTEFVCTPRANDNDGRDQHNAFKCLLAGPGISRIT